MDREKERARIMIDRRMNVLKYRDGIRGRERERETERQSDRHSQRQTETDRETLRWSL